ncbi:MAG: hypothetical protein CL610_06335 [Anaerolineaceae bacterium]|nr:hypothetical protein [Anaerolineaceae bacterium]
MPPIVRAAQSSTLLDAALAYADLGMSLIPLTGKRPALTSWTQYQKQSASPEDIHRWGRAGLLQNIGIVCGPVSDNLVVLDLDGAAGYPAFAATFPHLAQTYTIATGGGVGKHVYFRVDGLTASVRAMATPIGNLELCGQGRQVVASPSSHPETGKPYQVEKALDILHITDLEELAAWIETFKPRQSAAEWHPPPSFRFPAGDASLNPRVIDAIAQTLVGQGFTQRGDWLHGSCIHPEHHQNGDRNPSFGFNLKSAYG